MPIKPSKMQSWQIFHYARKHLGRVALYAIFGKKNARAVDYWCEDPSYTDKSDTAYDPVQGIKRMLAALDDQGHIGVVRSCIAYLTQDTGLDCGQEPQVEEPLPTIWEEVLADYQAVAKLQVAIEAKEDVQVVYDLKEKALHEIERTYAKYCEECQTR